MGLLSALRRGLLMYLLEKEGVGLPLEQWPQKAPGSPTSAPRRKTKAKGRGGKPGATVTPRKPRKERPRPKGSHRGQSAMRRGSHRQAPDLGRGESIPEEW